MTPSEPGLRLQKFLAAAGIGSRRSCEEFIVAGRVTVNGQPARLGDRVGAGDRVRFDDVPVTDPQSTVHYLVNKPAGVLSSVSDARGRPCVVDLVDDDRRLFPVGRLDVDTEGLIIVTNDGELTHLLTHPSFGVDKAYLASVTPSPTRGALAQLRRGVELDDGLSAPAKVSLLADGGGADRAAGLVRIVIHEGRNRQVRRMFEAVGCTVERLVRERIGPLSDAKLRPGGCRLLTGQQVRSLYAAVQQPHTSAEAS